MMLSINKVGEKYMPEALFRLESEVFGSDQQTPIYFNGYIYGVRPDEQLVCLAPDGRIQWTSSSAHKFGLGPYTIINGLIYVMNDEGYLTVARATPDAYRPLTAAQVLQGHESWGPMAFASGRLIVRDLTRMVCLDIMKITPKK
jgi:outer membrane protein assembly factor BamB